MPYNILVNLKEGRNGEIRAMHRLTELIREDMKPALGVTEPGAIAYAAAEARSRITGEIKDIKKVRVALNSGMYKNAFTCGIPNSAYYGNLYAAALGVVAAKPELGLMSLRDITPEDDRCAARLVESGRVEVCLDHIGSDIMIDAAVETDKEGCVVHIRGSHTHITAIEKNGEYIYREESAGGEAESFPESPGTEEQDGGQESAVIHQYSLHDIFEYVSSVEYDELGFIREAFSVNMGLFKEGMASERTVILKQLLKDNGGEIISGDARKTAQLVCNGAIEARVLGLNSPAMSITGSGAHGIIAVMPLYAYCKAGEQAGKEADGRELDEDTLLRAAALSYLITMYIKEYSGKLSAFCGCGIAAGTGMACGLGYLKGAGEKELAMIIRNMASGLTGMICDGGNHGCAMKGIVAVDAAFRAAELSMAHVCIDGIHGINGRTPEETMRYMGRIASPGMEETERTIVEIMEQKVRRNV